MDDIETGSSSNRIDYTQGQLIHGLPDDIALSCLARVPRRYHTLLKCVCKRWRDLVCSEEWCVYRRKHNVIETWIYALCRDKSEQMHCYVLDPDSPRRYWKLIGRLPDRCLNRKGMGFEALEKHLYLLGGCGWSKDASNEAYCYDVLTNSWSEATPLSTARCYFACEVLDGKIYAIGGLGSNLSDPHTWDTFDPHKNSWESHADSNIIPDVEDSVVLNRKIYIRCGTSAVSPHIYAVLYEPSNGTWQHADADMVSGWHGPAVVVDERLYVLDQSSGTRLMMWEKDSKEWLAVGRFSSLLTRPPCRMVAIGRRIFIIGKGLSTVVFNVGQTANMEGITVGSSIHRLESDHEVIACKCLTV